LRSHARSTFGLMPSSFASSAGVYVRVLVAIALSPPFACAWCVTFTKGLYHTWQLESMGSTDVYKPFTEAVWPVGS
jgi:hypothetical protein